MSIVVTPKAFAILHEHAQPAGTVGIGPKPYDPDDDDGIDVTKLPSGSQFTTVTETLYKHESYGPHPRIYLAGRYSRREELCLYRDEAQSLGYVVTSRWLDGEHQLHPHPEKVDGHDGQTPFEAEPFARDDFHDVLRADIVILFTEPPRSTASRGGRHVEFGIGLAARKELWIVGPRENVFHTLHFVHQYEDWQRARATLNRQMIPYQDVVIGQIKEGGDTLG